MDGSFFPERDVQDQRVSYVEFRQRCSADFHRLHISKTAILRIRSGSKTVRTISGLETTVAQGEFVYLRRGENLTIGNIIGDTGFYYSEGLFIDDAVISEFLSVHPNRRHTSDVRKGDMSAAFDDAFTRVVDGLVDQTLPGAFLDHRTPGSSYRNSITCINAAYNHKAFNDGYHIGHHLYPNLHWTEMPINFEEDIPKYIENKCIVKQTSSCSYIIFYFSENAVTAERCNFCSCYKYPSQS